VAGWGSVWMLIIAIDNFHTMERDLCLNSENKDTEDTGYVHKEPVKLVLFQLK